MNRIAPILLALGLACLLSQLDGDLLQPAPEAGEFGVGTMLVLAVGAFATWLGSINLYRRWSRN